MKKLFSGYYRPTDKEYSVLWKTCIFVFDANVLLNLYQYSQKTRDELIGVIKLISERLWIPHQAALEYQRQRLQVIFQQKEVYDAMNDLLNKTKKQLEDKIRLLNNYPDIADSLSKRIKKAFIAIEKDLKKCKRMHPDLIKHDSLNEILTSLFEGKTGTPYSAGQLNEIYKLGERRYKQGVPPGYKDEIKEGINKFGDLVLWLQIIDKAKATKKPIILVTDDRKEDWWQKLKGQIISPRPELIGEMLSEAGVTFYMYQADQYLEYASKYLEKQVTQKSIEEVRDIKKRDEDLQTDTILNRLNDLSSVRLSDEGMNVLNGITSVRLNDALLDRMKDLTSVRLDDETLDRMKGLTSIRLNDALLDSMKGLASTRISDALMDSMKGLASIRLSDALMDSMKGLASTRISNATLKRTNSMTENQLSEKPDDILDSTQRKDMRQPGIKKAEDEKGNK